MSFKTFFYSSLRGIIYFLFYKLPSYIAVKRQLSKTADPIVTVKQNGISYRMQLDLTDGGISQDIFYARIREYPNVSYFIKFIEKYGSSIDTVIEVGANIGYYYLFANAIFKKRFKKKLKIFAIEPVSENFELLEKNMKLNNVKNTTLIHGAIGDKNKFINVIVPRERNLSHLEDIENVSSIHEYTQEKVKMITLSHLFSSYSIPRKNVLFRWDIEGYEYNILKGNIDIFRSLKKAFIIMEFHPQLLKRKKSLEFLKLLKSTGFEIEYTVSCYPLYFFINQPRFMTQTLNKLWVMEKGGNPLGFQEYFSIDDLIKEFTHVKSPLYDHPNLHLYLVKHD